MVITTVVPLIFTAAKAMPSVVRFLKFFWGLLKNGLLFGRSPLWSIIVAAIGFVGGIGFFVSLYMGWGFQIYLKVLDLIFTPFSLVAEALIKAFIDQLPNLPANTSSILCLFDFGSVFVFITLGFSFEVYLRLLIYFFLKRK